MKHLVAFLLILLSLVYACKQQDVSGLPPLPTGYVEVQTGKSILTPAGLTVTADTVYLSICPKTTDCFAPDNVFASLRVGRNQESQSVRLFAFFGIQSRRDGSLSDSASVRLGGQLYKVILQGQYIGETDQSRLGRAIIQVATL